MPEAGRYNVWDRKVITIVSNTMGFQIFTITHYSIVICLILVCVANLKHAPALLRYCRAKKQLSVGAALIVISLVWCIGLFNLPSAFRHNLLIWLPGVANGLLGTYFYRLGGSKTPPIQPKQEINAHRDGDETVDAACCK